MTAPSFEDDMKYTHLTDQESNKYDSALVAIIDNISIIHDLGLEEQLLNDLDNLAHEQLNKLIAIAVRMNIGREQVRNVYW